MCRRQVTFLSALSVFNDDDAKKALQLKLIFLPPRVSAIATGGFDLTWIPVTRTVTFLISEPIDSIKVISVSLFPRSKLAIWFLLLMFAISAKIGGFNVDEFSFG